MTASFILWKILFLCCSHTIVFTQVQIQQGIWDHWKWGTIQGYNKPLQKLWVRQDTLGI